MMLELDIAKMTEVKNLFNY
ncbi:hypothetical protein Gohar_015341 [Gossypium harknessii]|uniref:Uncharacterized protein n=1 Tax=Gossypium harknessii TaxID=34285 RepID=A0A7J9FZZ9_9ROSI|nr:hypothetical protein [Gossypium harknessii]